MQSVPPAGNYVRSAPSAVHVVCFGFGFVYSVTSAGDSAQEVHFVPPAGKSEHYAPSVHSACSVYYALSAVHVVCAAHSVQRARLV